MNKKNLKKESITIMIPAYNEEKYLEITANMVDDILKDIFNDYEILIFDDYSKDRTPEIADVLSYKNPKIRVIHNERNRGLGYNFRKGAEIAKKKHYCTIMADIDCPAEPIKKIFEQTGNTDLIVSYIEKDERPIYRRFVSKGFTTALNILFGLNLKYYCGIVVFKTDALKKVNKRTDSFAMNAEAIVQMIKNEKQRYIEMTYLSTDKGRTNKSAVFKAKNITGAFLTIARLFSDVYLK